MEHKKEKKDKKNPSASAAMFDQRLKAYMAEIENWIKLHDDLLKILDEFSPKKLPEFKKTDFLSEFLVANEGQQLEEIIKKVASSVGYELSHKEIVEKSAELKGQQLLISILEDLAEKAINERLEKADLICSVGNNTADEAAVLKNYFAFIAQYWMGLGKNQNVPLVVSISKAIQEIDKQIIFKSYKQSADKQEPAGLYGLGECYQHGCGVDKDEKEAAKYYQLAVENGYQLPKMSLADSVSFSTSSVVGNQSSSSRTAGTTHELIHLLSSSATSGSFMPDAEKQLGERKKLVPDSTHVKVDHSQCPLNRWDARPRKKAKEPGASSITPSLGVMTSNLGMGSPRPGSSGGEDNS